MDYNITGRADFQNHASVSTKHLHHPGQSRFRVNLKDNQIIATSKLVVSCIAGYSNFIPFPPVPNPTITITELIENQPCGVGTVFNFSPYKVPTQYEILLDSPAFFEITITFCGCLYTFLGNRTISHKEAIGFAMQGPNRQGQVVLDEGAFDHFNDYMISVGGPDFRSLPFSMEALNQLPEVMQGPICNLLFNPVAREKALTTQRLKALPIDAVKQFAADAAKGTPLDKLDPEYLMDLGRHMMSLGWKKD